MNKQPYKQRRPPWASSSSSVLGLALVVAVVSLHAPSPAAAVDSEPPPSPSKLFFADIPQQQQPWLPQGGGMVDSWADDKELRLFRRMQDIGARAFQGKKQDGGGGGGDSMERSAAVMDLLLTQQATQMKEMWSDPRIAHTLLQRFPMFSALPGVPALASKAAEDFTREDGLAVLDKMKAFAVRTVAGMGIVTDPVRLAETLEAYSSLGESNLAMRALYEDIEAGDPEAAWAFHDLVAEDVWQGTLDLGKFGTFGWG